MNSLSAVNEPIIDNDLVVGVTYDYVSFRVGESWTPASTKNSIFIYPGSDILYGVSMYGTYSEYASEQNYFAYVLQRIREEDGVEYANVLEGEKPYTTADGREATISRLRFKQSADGVEIYHDADLLIIPEEKYFFVFSVAYSEDETVPLDIREVVDTAIFDFGPLSFSDYEPEDVTVYTFEDVPEEEYFYIEGHSFYDRSTDRAFEFADSDSFFIYADPENRVTNYAYGTYKVYRGEDAYEQLYENPEFGSTRELRQDRIDFSFSQEFMSEFDDKPHRFGNEDFFTIVFDSKGFVASDDDPQIDFLSVYYGFYIRDYDVMVMFDGSDDHYYIWEIEENEE